MQTILAQKFHYLLVCKRESHPWLYDYVDHLETQGKKDVKHTIEKREWTGNFYKITTISFTNHVPLKDSHDSLFVNWCGVKVTKEEDGRQLYHNAFITNHTLTAENVATIIVSGRARWKIENENNNTLKTKGYNFEHNFGHGEQTLSLVLLTLILLSFLFHTLLDLFNAPYQRLCILLKRQFFFSGIRELTQYFYAISWDHLFMFMQEARTRQFTLPTTPFAALPSSSP
jgi:hypothetical protein